jgi:hypothetical protein
MNDNFLKGRIITPGAKGIIEGESLEVAFPIDLPIMIIAHDSMKVTAREPHNKTVTFQTNDVQITGVDETWWDLEWVRHSDPEKHRWDLVEIINKYGAQTYTDWECGPHPVREYKDLFAGVFLACMTYELTKGAEFYNALIDLSLLMFGEIDDVDISQDYIDATVFTIYQLLTCRKFTKSGIDWSNLNQVEWLDKMESLKK